MLCLLVISAWYHQVLPVPPFICMGKWSDEVERTLVECEEQLFSIWFSVVKSSLVEFNDGSRGSCVVRLTFR